MAEDTNQNATENPMGGGGFVSPFEQLSINLDNYFNSDDFKEGNQPGNLNPFSQPPSGGAPSGDGAPSEGGNPFGGNPFEFNPLGGEENTQEESINQDNPMMSGYDSYRNDSDNTDEPLIVGENPFGDINDADIDSDNLFANLENLSESFSDNLEAGKTQYESFTELFNDLEASEASTDTQGDELAPVQFTNFLNTLSESDIELPSDGAITDLSQFSDLASSFSQLNASNGEAFIETFSEVDFTAGSGNPFSEGNPFIGEDNPFTQITEIFAVDSDSAVSIRQET
jgi:hypothetical protein